MTQLTPHPGVAQAYATVAYAHRDDDDLKNVRRYLYRNLGYDAGPRIFIEPLEAEFTRPGITIRLVRSSPTGRAAARPTWDVQHTLVLTVYGRTRAETIDVAEQTWGLLHDGGQSGGAYRIPMWDFGSNNRLERMLRVDTRSLTMSLETPDDDGQWSRTIEMQVRAPRIRPVSLSPLMGFVTITQNN